MGRVLVVDDDTDVRAALRMLLEEDGHSIIELDDGLTVLETISEYRVDVILLDISMPQVDGFEVLSMLLLDPISTGIPVIVVSARGRPNDKAQAMALGASDYVNKPWGEGEVEFRVRMALGKTQGKSGTVTSKPPEELPQPISAPAQPVPVVSPMAPPAHLQRSRPPAPAARPAAPRPQQGAPAKTSRPTRPMRRPAPAPQSAPASQPAPAPQPMPPPGYQPAPAQRMPQTPAQPASAGGPTPLPLRRRPRVRRTVRRIRRRAA